MTAKKILVIDDDELVIQTVKNLLSRQRYETTTCTSGQEALELVASKDFDLILCDIRMPGINGVETVKQIKALLKERDRANIPMFFFTGYADDDSYAKAQTIGEVLLKPYDIHELLNLVQKHLRER